jgi:hypothetical protein
MRLNPSPFKWSHYAPDVILLCVRWYCRYQLSYRDMEGVEALWMMRKSQVKRLDGRDTAGQARFVESLFGMVA